MLKLVSFLYVFFLFFLYNVNLMKGLKGCLNYVVVISLNDTFCFFDNLDVRASLRAAQVMDDARLCLNSICFGLID